MIHKICSAGGCGEKHFAHGFCGKHYNKAKWAGKIVAIRVVGLPLKDRLQKYSSSNHETGCIEWVGGKHFLATV